MKLYFYVFDGDKLEFSECEAEEKAKSYTLKEKAKGFYGTRILKSELGLKQEYEWKQTVVLDKRDDELAKQYLSDYLNNRIDEKKKEIEELKGKLKLVSEWKADQPHHSEFEEREED